MRGGWIGQQRRRWVRNNAHLYVRQDAHRFAPPDAAHSWRAPDARWDPLGAAERKYSPNQPRVPAGNRDGGQWTTVSSGGGISIAVPAGGVVGADAENSGTFGDFDDAIDSGDLGGLADEDFTFNEVQLAGDIPTGDSPPEIPEERPATSPERTSFLKAAARRVAAGVALHVLTASAPWLLTQAALINSYNDPPKSLEELQQAVATDRPGTDIHHIVEQSAAAGYGFSRDVIDSPENLVRIPRLKHQEINAWYQKPNPDYSWKTPRQYLSGRNLEVRRAVGLEVLRKFGVLKQ